MAVTTTKKEAAEKKPAEKKPAAKKPAAKKSTAKKPVTKTTGTKNKIPPSVETEQAVLPPKKILFVASEALPFAATGGLGEVIGSLPKAMMEQPGAFDVRVILPLYGDIGAEYRSRMELVCSYYVRLAWREIPCAIYQLVQDCVTYYFLDQEQYFRRGGLYGFYDDGERFAFFCKAVVDSFGPLGFTPDLVHAHDWQCALVPIYLKCKYHNTSIKTVFTIHNVEYQGKYSLDILGDIFDLPQDAGGCVEFCGSVNLMKGAIECSDWVTTVSPSYAAELHYGYYAHGLEEIISRNSYKISGILNGIDQEGYDPATDTALFQNYSADTVADKAKDKEELQKLANLPVDPEVPLIAVITRLVAHKGVDLITYAAEDILKERVQLVVLGKGDRRFEDYFTWLGGQYPCKVSAMITYNKDLSRKVYAGADLFLMPSKSEPCGLSQMIACRYGTVPIVRATGGLQDSIRDCSCGEGNGFVFQTYHAADMTDAVTRARRLYDDKPNWENLRRYIMTMDFSWDKSAKLYEAMYGKILG